MIFTYNNTQVRQPLPSKSKPTNYCQNKKKITCETTKPYNQLETLLSYNQLGIKDHVGNDITALSLIGPKSFVRYTDDRIPSWLCSQVVFGLVIGTAGFPGGYMVRGCYQSQVSDFVGVFNF